MIAMTFDVSKSATGWAVMDDDWYDSGVLKCPVKKPFHVKQGSIDAMYSGRVERWFRPEIWQLVKLHEPDVIGIEQPMPGNIGREKMVTRIGAGGVQVAEKQKFGNTSFDTTHFLHGLAMVVCGICVEFDIPCEFIASQSWRSTCNIGHPPKLENYDQRKKWLKNKAREFAAHRIGIDVISPDEAEALCMAHHLRMTLDRRMVQAGQRDLFEVIQ